MKLQNTSIFNLIEIFSKGGRKAINTIHPKTHCEQKALHDFYCEKELIPVQK
ncbi:hypothetical protein [Aquimarina pacifica]|uniref:hypothetical protein n=1 Tax=Aquimarina pacifica TaxID=1296415 RepID=UPI0004BBF96E|nr:hypothetical protein [Aquimarina pacifica]